MSVSVHSNQLLSSFIQLVLKLASHTKQQSLCWQRLPANASKTHRYIRTSVVCLRRFSVTVTY